MGKQFGKKPFKSGAAGARATGTRSGSTRTTGARAGSPRASGSRASAPRASAPRSSGPRASGSRTSGSRAPGTRPSGPRFASARPAGSSTTGSQPILKRSAGAASDSRPTIRRATTGSRPSTGTARPFRGKPSTSRERPSFSRSTRPTTSRPGASGTSQGLKLRSAGASSGEATKRNSRPFAPRRASGDRSESPRRRPQFGDRAERPARRSPSGIRSPSPRTAPSERLSLKKKSAPHEIVEIAPSTKKAPVTRERATIKLKDPSSSPLIEPTVNTVVGEMPETAATRTRLKLELGTPRTKPARTLRSDELPALKPRRLATHPKLIRPNAGTVTTIAGKRKIVSRKMQGEAAQKAAAEGIPEGLESMRLNRFIASSGVTSRRKADGLITRGAVRVNGEVVKEMGVQIKPFEDKITVNGEPISLKMRLTYLLLNKPKDTITTTSDEFERNTVMDLIKTNERVYPVGRLDRNTTGVLLLTNDGELTNRLTHPKYEIEREYHVSLDKPLDKADAKKIAEGDIDIGDGEKTGPAELAVADRDAKDLILKIKEGKNREIRRLFEVFGYDVKKLDRVNFAGITHRGMSRGEVRSLAPSEVRKLKRLVGIKEE